jgi:hypothetical protein
MYVSFYSETFSPTILLFDKHVMFYAKDPRETGLGLHVKYLYLLYDFGNLRVLMNFRRIRPIKKVLKKSSPVLELSSVSKIQTSTIKLIAGVLQFLLRTRCP